MDKISPIKERILQFIENQNIKKVDFCNTTGISYANLKGKSLYSEIGGDKIAEILSIYPFLNAEWLLTGKGQMLKGISPKTTEDEDKTINLQPIADIIEKMHEEVKTLSAQLSAQVTENQHLHYKNKELQAKIDKLKNRRNKKEGREENKDSKRHATYNQTDIE